MRYVRTLVRLMVLAGTLLLSVSSYADEHMDDTSMHELAPFDAGTWSLHVIGGAYEESFGGEGETLMFGSVAIEGMIFDNIAGFAEFTGYHIDQQEPDAEAFGFALGARWYFLHPAPSLALFAEGSLGVFEGFRRVPTPDGTHFNFTIMAGVGARYQITDNVSLIAAARYFHLSNASTQGEDRNPSIDAVGGYGGITINF